MQRKIKTTVKGGPTIDGAGVHLIRVLGRDTVEEFDPLLMLDSFDTTNYDDYKGGFPEHPHRGIETISYIWKGGMTHKDSMGNEDTVGDGEVQWMTAGSGIMHSETIPKSDRLLGVQLWLNLPAKDKMTSPDYKAIKREDVKEIPFDGGKIRLLAGTYKDEKGYQSKYLPLDYYDIQLEPNKSITIETDEDRSIALFTLIGDVKVGGEEVEEKTAVKLTQGDSVEIEALDNNAQVLFMSSTKLEEPVVWGGPIVMNTHKQMQEATMDLHLGTFVKEKMDIE
ncbi:MAG: pirin family protein [Finegoldia sp.]|nr:pirin family protein [Finegoldia sp.]